LIKAAKEAKVNTSWIQEDARWEESLRDYVRAVFAFPKLWKELAPFALRVAEIGMHNSLAQLLLKIASPGVPDFYQGTELWDLALVDPDTRRPVDFALRARLLGELANPAALYAQWRDGRVKMFVMQAALKARREHGELFGGGSYEP